MHRAARMLRRVEALRRDAVRELRAQHGVPVTIARPFNNYGPGLKITDRRVIPDLARDVLDGRDIVLLSDGIADAHVLLRGRRRTGYYKVLVTRRAGRAVQHRDRGAGDLDGRARRADRRARRRERRRLPREVVHGISAPRPDYLVDNPNRRCPGSSARPATTSATSRPSRSTTASTRSLIWYTGEPRRRGRLMRSPSSAPATSGSSPAAASPSAGTTSSASTSTPRRVEQIRAGRGADPRARARRAPRAQRWAAAARHDRPRARPCSTSDLTLDRGRHAVRRRPDRPRRRRGPRPRRSARRFATKTRYHVVVVKSTVVPGTTDRRRASRCSRRLRQDGGRATSASA